MLRWLTPLWLIALAITAVVLFQVNAEVQEMEDDLAAVQRQIVKDKEALQVLSAEWSYLNRPSRIAELSQRHLELAPLEVGQIFEADQLPDKPEDLGYLGDRLTKLPPQLDLLPLPDLKPATPIGFVAKAPKLVSPVKKVPTQVVAVPKSAQPKASQPKAVVKSLPAQTSGTTKVSVKLKSPAITRQNTQSTTRSLDVKSASGGAKPRINPVTGRPLPPLDGNSPALAITPVSSGATQ
ncbi:cell division protein FtsL [Rhodovibrionaceae bacterium A322]